MAMIKYVRILGIKSSGGVAFRAIGGKPKCKRTNIMWQLSKVELNYCGFEGEKGIK